MYLGLDQGSNIHYLLNGIRCDNLFTAVEAVKAYLDKHEKDFDTFLTQYINKREPTLSMKVAFIAQSRPAKH